MTWEKVGPRSIRSAEMRAGSVERGFGEPTAPRFGCAGKRKPTEKQQQKKRASVGFLSNQCRVAGPELHRPATSTPEPR